MTAAASHCESCCPLCGGPNQCAMAQTGSIVGCWCREAVFTRELLAQIPETLRGRACVCRSCAERAISPPSNIEVANGDPVES